MADGGKSVILLSDVHLGPVAEAAVNHRFLAFIGGLDAARVSALYILGDLFDVWVGDDGADDAARQVQAALVDLNRRGIMVFVQHGNRDFMLGMRFARASRVTFLPPAYVLETAAGGRWLLAHGDALVDDAAYLSYRRRLRNPLVLLLAALLPLRLRRYLAAKMRAASRGGVLTARLDERLTAAVLRRHRCRHLVHGHLHRHGRSDWQHEGESYSRWCLPAWEDGGGYAEIRGDTLRLELLPPQEDVAEKPAARPAA